MENLLCVPWLRSVPYSQNHDVADLSQTYSRQAPSTEGKHYLIGCSGWSKTEKFNHLYLPIPAAVDEHVLRQLMNGATLDIPEMKTYEDACTTFVHPRHGKQKTCS
jgi:hypothetical protein